jgi:16S rRNA (adenine1518-N6/adenine1519-N6)-dimethyltransferase
MKTNIDAAEIASKRFGQNFLKDHRYVDQIIQAMPDDDLPVVEIGPGLGDLTSALIRVRSVTAFEVDKRLCEHLHDEFGSEIDSERLRLVCGDALEHWEQKGLMDEPYHLVANLPYYIATHLILKALHDPMCQSILVMVQKEVALKFAAQSGERDFSSLSVLAASAGEAWLRFEVPPEAFVPPPKVTSAVLSIRKERTLEDAGFERFLKIAFAQPRKKLSKNLERAFAKETIRSAFETLELDGLARPHEATTTIYHHLYTTLKKDFKDGQEQSKSTKRKRRDTQHPSSSQP